MNDEIKFNFQAFNHNSLQFQPMLHSKMLLNFDDSEIKIIFVFTCE